MKLVGKKAVVVGMARSGVAAVEFALIALLMVGLLFGIYAISSGVARR